MHPLPECQALSLGPGRDIAARVVATAPDAPPQPRYHHFHPAAEIVWFRSAQAVMHVGDLTCSTCGGDLVFLPSMTPHDFDVAQDRTEFVLIFYDPAREVRLPPALQSRLSQGPLILRATPAQAARIDMLADWLVTASARIAARCPARGRRATFSTSSSR